VARRLAVSFGVVPVEVVPVEVVPVEVVPVEVVPVEVSGRRSHHSSALRASGASTADERFCT
jgi:hypothetical protein